MKKVFLPICIFLFFSACSTSNDCEDTLCFSPPPHFEFKIVDASTGENLFSNGTFSEGDIRLIDDNGKPVQYRFISEDERNHLNLGLGWVEGSREYTLTLSPEVQLLIKMNVDKKNENCCITFEITNFNISPYEYEVDNTSDVYTISIPVN